MTPEFSSLALTEEPSFTLPARPGMLAPEPVDLLADRRPRRLPEGTVQGFAVVGALVVFSCLVGGLTAGFVVIGVSTLLAAIAAIVRGKVSLAAVGGQRGAALLLGAAVTALIVPSVTPHDLRPVPELSGGVPVPISSPFAVGTESAYAAAPSVGATAREGAPSGVVPTPSSSSPSSDTGPGLTLSPDALSPVGAHGPAQDDSTSGPRPGHGRGVGNGSGGAVDQAAQRAAEKAAKAHEKAAAALRKAAAKAAKTAQHAAKIVSKAASTKAAAAATTSPAPGRHQKSRH